MCIPRILALGTHSISLPLITMGSKELFAVLKVIRSSLHFASLSWNLSSAALVTKVSTAVWMVLGRFLATVSEMVVSSTYFHSNVFPLKRSNGLR